MSSAFVNASAARPALFVVAYRVGGTQNAEWRASLPVIGREAADRLAADIRRGGRKALVKTAAEVRQHGLPVGW